MGGLMILFINDSVLPSTNTGSIGNGYDFTYPNIGGGNSYDSTYPSAGGGNPSMGTYPSTGGGYNPYPDGTNYNYGGNIFTNYNYDNTPTNYGMNYNGYTSTNQPTSYGLPTYNRPSGVGSFEPYR